MQYLRPTSIHLDLRLLQALNSGAILVDVRTHCEHAGCHLDKALNIPYDEIERHKALFSASEKPVVTFSTYGRRSELAYRKLCSMGVEALDARTLGNVRKALESCS